MHGADQSVALQPWQLGHQKPRCFWCCHAESDVGDSEQVLFRRLDLVQRRPGDGLHELVTESHADDVKQVRIRVVDGLAQVEQTAQVFDCGMMAQNHGGIALNVRIRVFKRTQRSGPLCLLDYAAICKNPQSMDPHRHVSDP